MPDLVRMLFPLLLLELGLELFESDEEEDEGDDSVGVFEWLLMMRPVW
mgnify:CR=1 FL=1